MTLLKPTRLANSSGLVARGGRASSIVNIHAKSRGDDPVSELLSHMSEKKRASILLVLTMFRFK